MKWLKSLFTTIGVMLLGMFGGQREKGARRFGIFGLVLTIDSFNKRTWPLILIVPILALGYGENSFLYEKLGSDWLVRFVYAFLLSLPFLFYGLRRWMCAWPLLVISFQIHAGSLGHLSWFGDILIEDILRYSTLGVLISFNLFITKQND